MISLGAGNRPYFLKKGMVMDDEMTELLKALRYWGRESGTPDRDNVMWRAADKIEAILSENATIRDALENAKGLIDTPIGRRRHAGDDFYTEVVSSINGAIGEKNKTP